MFWNLKSATLTKKLFSPSQPTATPCNCGTLTIITLLDNFGQHANPAQHFKPQATMAPSSTKLNCKTVLGSVNSVCRKISVCRGCSVWGLFLRWALHTQSSTRRGGAGNASTVFPKPKYKWPMCARHGRVRGPFKSAI